MSRLRYIVDRPRGPRGGNNDQRTTFKGLSSARNSAGYRKEWTTARGEVIRAEQSKGVVLCVDLDELLHVEATEEEHYEWHERQALRHTAEAMRLKPRGTNTTNPSWLSTDDIARLKEAASEWTATFPRRDAKHPRTPQDNTLLFLLKELLEGRRLG